MKLIISPAKKMNQREDELEISGMPPFMEQTGQILQYMRPRRSPETVEMQRFHRGFEL